MAEDITTLCVGDIETKAKATGLFLDGAGKDKVFSVYSETDLFDKAKMLKVPMAGVMYEGLRSNNMDGSNQGLAPDCFVAIAVLVGNGSVGGVDQKNAATQILDALRKNIRTTKSPTGHKWKFVSEMPAGDMHGCFVYVQRWSTPTILTN